MNPHRPTATSFIDQYAVEWHTATHHPFLTDIRDGSLAAPAFKRWLEQDYLFVGDLLHFQARLAARAPRADQNVLIGGLVALDAWVTRNEPPPPSRHPRVADGTLVDLKTFHSQFPRIPGVKLPDDFFASIIRI